MTNRHNRGKDGTHPLDHSYVPDPDGVVEDLGGDELTRRTVTHYPLDSLTPERARKILGGGAEGFWKDMEDNLAECARIMAEHDWVSTPEGSTSFPNDHTAKPFSDLWYAGMIGSSYWNFLHCHRKNDPNTEMIGQAIWLGELIKDWEWRSRYRDTIVKKLKQDTENRFNGKKGGQADKRKARYAALDKMVAARLDEFNRVNDKSKVNLLKKWAAEYDGNEAEPLFQQNHTLLSRGWFEDWLSHFYQEKS